MELEILFRGQRTVNKEWVYGYYNLVTAEGTDYHYIFWQGNEESVIYETVGQYIGLKDKNEKHIFDGDIIECGNNKYFISFENGAFYAYHSSIKDIDNKPYRWGLVSRFSELNIEIEVIGNIHDNPEFLKEKI